MAAKASTGKFHLSRTKPAEHFRSTPDGYFHGMAAKAKAGELDLGRTLLGLRQAADPKSGGATRPRSS
jgi:hypothetical protein